MSCRLLIGDVFDRLAEVPDGSVDLIVTSPPFLALRSYLPAGHPDKAKEIGSEATPAEYLETLLRLTAEWRRVLAPHGSIAVELGDTYAGSGGDYNRPGWPLDKSLCGIPTLYTWSLAYGRNLLTGEPTPAGQWRVRNLVVWVKPNPPVGRLSDKYRPAASYVTVATLAHDRWFDLDAIRTPLTEPEADRRHVGRSNQHDQARASVGLSSGNGYTGQNPIGAPPLDWWQITGAGYPGAHYAVMPAEIAGRLVESMCPHRVCTTCGRPSRRIVETEPSPLSAADRVQRTTGDAGRASVRPNGKTHMGIARRAITVGWTDCGHDSWRPGLVLDPFAGSGTTLAVASGMGRDSIGIDLDERNAHLALERVGMFLEVIYDHQEATHG